jgi:hypothetical protein
MSRQLGPGQRAPRTPLVRVAPYLLAALTTLAAGSVACAGPFAVPPPGSGASSAAHLLDPDPPTIKW